MLKIAKQGGWSAAMEFDPQEETGFGMLIVI
jgi:hypothetical protein